MKGYRWNNTYEMMLQRMDQTWLTVEEKGGGDKEMVGYG